MAQNALSFCCSPAPPVENGDAEMAVEETWDQKGAEPSEAEPGGGSGSGSGIDESPAQAADESPQDEGMEDEEETTPAHKAAPIPKDAPKKEHVNVVFIGHVGQLVAQEQMMTDDNYVNS